MSGFTNNLPRDLSRRDWRTIWRIIRKSERPNIWDESTEACRQRVAKTIADCAVDGRVALNVDQMDCDCSRWTSSRDLPASVFAVERAMDRVWMDAEGPVYGIWITAPEDKAEYSSRDLALEAFEDGHSHVVSSVRFDEGGSYG